MRAYVFQGALRCEECASRTKDLLLEGSSVEQADTGDSDTFPQGPYSDGGGEADCPQHCDHCGAFLENPLTRDGEDYVREHLRGRGAHVAPEWRERYAYLFTGEEEEGR